MSAIISKCGRYRYRLERELGPGKSCLFIMLNPSKADAKINDATIKRCMSYASGFGYGKLIVGNLFAFRTTWPVELKKATDPVGPENLMHLEQMCSEADLVIAAWGVDGNFRGQDEIILKELRRWKVKLHYLKLTKNGHPSHPGRLAGDLKPQRWQVTCDNLTHTAGPIFTSR